MDIPSRHVGIEHHATLSKQRLTWDPLCPAPFESAWSVVLKVCKLNSLSFDELIALIQKEGAVLPIRRPFYTILFNSSWIDFQKFSDLLGVSVSRLKECFLDQLGFQIPKELTRPIRACPKCRRLEYQCTFFDLAMIAECPWHREQLLSPCVPPLNMETINEVAICMTLGTDSVHGSRQQLKRIVLPLNLVETELAATILGYCRELIDWWSRAVSRVRHPDLIRDLVSLFEHRQRHYQLQLGLALKAASMDLYWTLAAVPADARIISWRRRPATNFSGPVPKATRENAYAVYKSLRRNLWNTHLRHHHRCV